MGSGDADENKQAQDGSLVNILKWLLNLPKPATSPVEGEQEVCAVLPSFSPVLRHFQTIAGRLSSVFSLCAHPGLIFERQASFFKIGKVVDASLQP